MNDNNQNPRERLGSNNPPIWAVLKGFAAEENFAATVSGFLADEYKQWPITVAELLDEARALPAVIEDDATKAKVTTLMKRLRDTAAKIDKIHTAEKEPYLRGGQAVDQFCFGLIGKLAKRATRDNPGAYDILQRGLTDYDNKKLAEEQERRRIAAAEEARKAREAQEKAAAEARAAEEARLAAERARAPAKIEEKTEAAKIAEQAASQAAVDVTVANARAEQAHIDTLAKSADIMRSRQDDGTMSTMAQEKYAEVVDRTKLDMATLWPYLDNAAIEKALRQWARVTDFNTPMAGAAIGRRNKSKVL